MINLLLIFFIASACLNLHYYYLIKKIDKNRPRTDDLQQFIADLLTNKNGLVQIKVINVEDIMLRSPRNRR